MVRRSRASAEAAARVGDAIDDPVRARLEALRGDPDVRWHMSRYTLERAIGALRGSDAPVHRPGAKSRRRKRSKRLL